MSRIYVVTDKESGKQHLVRANHPSGAIRRCVVERYTAEVASQDQLVALVGATPVLEDKEPESAPASE